MLKAGGETEKVGNQYEFNIVTLYYAKLLCDEVLYVQSESYDSAIAQGLDICVLIIKCTPFRPNLEMGLTISGL